jgi:hypothetical protein
MASQQSVLETVDTIYALLRFVLLCGQQSRRERLQAFAHAHKSCTRMPGFEVARQRIDV